MSEATPDRTCASCGGPVLGHVNRVYCTRRCREDHKIERNRILRNGGTDQWTNYKIGYELALALRADNIERIKWIVRAHATTPGPDGCWIWKGAPNQNGYGRVGAGRRNEYAHRFVYRMFIGDIEHETLHHKCHNTRCVNPEHLEQASNYLNTLEMYERTALRKRIAALEARIYQLEAELRGDVA